MLRAGRGNDLLEEVGVLAFGLSRGVRRDDLEAVDAAARTFPAVAGVVDGDAVAIGIVFVPLRNCRSSLVSLVVDVFAGFGAQECFFAGFLAMPTVGQLCSQSLQVTRPSSS